MTVKPFYRQITETGKMSICGMSAPHVVHEETTGFSTKFRGMKINEKCIGCNQCKEQCDAKLFKAIARDENGSYFINNNHCDVCGDCTLVCPMGVIDSYSK